MNFGEIVEGHAGGETGEVHQKVGDAGQVVARPLDLEQALIHGLGRLLHLAVCPF